MVEMRSDRSPLVQAQAILALAGFLVTLYLVIRDIMEGDYCPKLFGIPACYVVLVSFLLVMLGLLLANDKLRRMVYATGAISGFLIAVWFSANQFLDLKQCPKWFGLPLCYVSLLTFGTLLGLWIAAMVKKTDVPLWPGKR